MGWRILTLAGIRLLVLRLGAERGVMLTAGAKMCVLIC
uniref:Uncharacterized protein n=1 Tax=Arundo donax TaxID=35708 RepID=A0A0A8YPK6_ARUDO